MDKYYQLLDRDPSAVSPVWKVLHLACFSVVIITGFIAAYALGKSEEYFGHNCVLYASISFQTGDAKAPLNLSVVGKIPDNTVRPFNISLTQWGSVSVCNYCQFTPLCSTIFSIVWGALVIICSRGGAGYVTDEIYRPWRLIYPVMIFILISTTAMLASLLTLVTGVNQFCAQFLPVFNTTSCVKDIDVYTLSFMSTKRPMYVAITLGVVFTYICFFAGLVHLGIVVLRIVCIADFQLIRVTVVACKGKGMIINVLESSAADTPPSSEHHLKLRSVSYVTTSLHPENERSGNTTATDGIGPPIAVGESFSDGLSPEPKVRFDVTTSSDSFAPPIAVDKSFNDGVSFDPNAYDNIAVYLAVAEPDVILDCIIPNETNIENTENIQ